MRTRAPLTRQRPPGASRVSPRRRVGITVLARDGFGGGDDSDINGRVPEVFPGSGTAWANLAGTWRIANGRIKAPAGNEVQVRLGPVRSLDYTYEGTIALHPGSDPGPTVRHQDGSNYVLVTLTSGGTGVHTRTGGSYGQIASAGTTWAVGDRFRVKNTPTRVEVYKQTAAAGPWTFVVGVNTTAFAGSPYVGFRSNFSEVEFDDVLVYNDVIENGLIHVGTVAAGWSSGGGDPAFPGNLCIEGDRVVFGCVANASSIDPSGISNVTALMDENTVTGLRRSIFTKVVEAADMSLAAGVMAKGARFFGMDFYSVFRGPKAAEVPILSTNDLAIGAANVAQDGVALTGDADDLLLFLGSLGYNVGTLTTSVNPSTAVERIAAGVAGSGNRVNLTVDMVRSDGATARTHRLQSTGTGGLLGSIGVRLPT